MAALTISSLRNRIKIARLRAEQERLEAERKLQYLESINKKLLQEKDTLTEMLSNSSLSDDARQSVNDMITTVTGLLSAKASGTDSDVINIVNQKMEQLAENRNRFVLSVMLSYAAAHPLFTAALKERGLSDWETGYCCLYAMGLRGKDIGNLMGGSHAHHNRASVIRSKLGLTGHDTNLGRWLLKFAKETENGGQHTAM